MYVEYKTTLFNLFLPNKKPLLAKNMVLQIQKLANKIYFYKRDYIIKLLEKTKNRHTIHLEGYKFLHIFFCVTLSKFKLTVIA